MINMFENLLPGRRADSGFFVQCSPQTHQIVEGWFGPDYFSHLDIRCFACS